MTGIVSFETVGFDVKRLQMMEFPPTFVKIAQALGLNIPPTLLARADEVIE